MGYIESTLTGKEKIDYVAEYHWLYKAKALLLCIVVIGIIHVIRWLTTEIALTSRRFVIKTGWIARSTEEIAHRRIEEVGLDQGVLGRILGYGKVTVRGTGNATLATHDCVTKPVELRKAILAAQEAAE